MPIRVFLSHAGPDKPFVEEVKDFLEDGGDIECWLDKYEIDFGQNIVSRINDGLTESNFLLLFLSPATSNSPWVKEEWTAKFWSQVKPGETRLVPVLIGDCQFPTLLANKSYCDLRTNQLEGMRGLKASLLKSRPAVSGDGAGASLPYFVGREKELFKLKERLSQPGSVVPIIGMAGLGKTYLAREFIRRHGSLFEAVYEVNCQKKDLAGLTGELSTQLGLRLDGEVDQVARDLRQFLSAKRCMLLLDNVDDDQPSRLLPGGRSAVLITARDGTIPFLADYDELRPPEFNDREALDLFRSVLGPGVPADKAKQLFQKLGHLPMAIAVSAGLIKHDIRHTVDSLAAALPPLEKLAHGKSNVGRLLREAVGAVGENERRLLTAMAVCSPGGTRLGFAAGVAGLDESDSLDALQGLFSRSLVVEIDRAARRYRLHPLIREAASPSPELRRTHAQQVLRGLEGWEKAPLRAAELIEEAQQAERALAADPDPILQIATYAGNLARAIGRLGEAEEFYLRVQELATSSGRKDWLQVGLGNQAVILKAWGRLDEAMALHKKEEAICVELGDRDGLQRTYGNQALILKAWSRLDEAIALHKQQEAICVELGDSDGLQRTYGNQALILKAWSRLDEAIALHKQQEAICVELGDSAGLQASYGNQAVILRDWGRLDEAMALHKKEEAICVELGDRDGLQRTYGNQALILKAWSRLDEAMALHKNEEAICVELGDRAGLQASYGNQGLILKDWGRLDEAMALHKQQETICLELGDRAGLQASYGNQALILQDWDRLDEAMALHKKEEAICLELGDRAGLQASYGNQALILKAWGRLDEAIALHTQQEAICLELGNRAGLARCYWSVGLLAREQKDSATSSEKLASALAIFTELKMVRERDAVLQAISE